VVIYVHIFTFPLNISNILDRLPDKALDMHLNVLSLDQAVRLINGTTIGTVMTLGWTRLSESLKRLMNVKSKLVNESFVPGFTYTEEEALWAISMAKSRQFGLSPTVDGITEDAKDCLIPMADLPNHSTGAAQLSALDKANVGFRSKQNMNRGEMFVILL